jgi:quinol monooxygenase YgiN
MIVVVGRVRTDADKREQLVRIGQAVALASRADAGCISYRLYEDSEIENDFVFLEEWESDEALRRHFATPHVAEFMGRSRRRSSRRPTSNSTQIASSMDLADVSAG